jgi:hypothetical protein
LITFFWVEFALEKEALSNGGRGKANPCAKSGLNVAESQNIMGVTNNYNIFHPSVQTSLDFVLHVR